ncbi:MAG: DUF1738 domain-containing protein [Thermoguttaceae bacterium]|nr:DUF1738 domain-containing protein [Thermoguttaceae bacterium]
MNTKICDMVTAKILAQLDEGVVPWLRPWVAFGGAISRATGRPYSYLNQMILGGSGEWATFNQIRAEGGKVKKGVKSRPVIFWKILGGALKTIEEEGDSIEVRYRPTPYLTYYPVFNLDDAEGIEPKYIKEENMPCAVDADEKADKIAREYLEREGIRLIDGEIRDDAFYRVRADEIQIPHVNQYKSTAEYYSTLFHEIVHSTGADNRLNRKLTYDRSIQRRAQEELVAEIGAAALCALAGVQTPESLKNSAAYIEHWRNRIAEDNTLVVIAAGRAQKAVEFILQQATMEEEAEI